MSRPARFAPVLVLAALSALAGFVPGLLPARQTRPAAAREPGDPEKRLARIHEDIEALKKKIAEEDNKEKTILSSLDRTGFAKSLIRKEQAALAIALERNRRDLEAVGRDIPALQATLDREKDGLARVLVTLYKYGRLPALRFVLLSSDLRTFVSESKLLGVLASYQDGLIARYGRDLAELGRAAETLKARERETKALLGRAEAKRAELEAEERKSRSLMDQIRSNKRTYSQTIKELGVRAQELEKLLQGFEKERPAGSVPLVPLVDSQGRLPWPAGGKILQTFGPQSGPFNTVTMNNGVEIAPAPDDPSVRAVHEGKVAFADYFQGYGNLLIVDHGQAYYSLYGHLSDFLVEKGDFVKAGQAVGLAGDTGSMVGVAVYFEIRFKTRPLDPLQWLSRR